MISGFYFHRSSSRNMHRGCSFLNTTIPFKGRTRGGDGLHRINSVRIAFRVDDPVRKREEDAGNDEGDMNADAPGELGVR